MCALPTEMQTFPGSRENSGSGGHHAFNDRVGHAAQERRVRGGALVVRSTGDIAGRREWLMSATSGGDVGQGAW